jgi:hypothetical protein
MNIIATLRQEESRLKQQLSAVQNAIAALNGGSPVVTRRRGKLSAAGRARIAQAARARWAKVRARKSRKAKQSK